MEASSSSRVNCGVLHVQVPSSSPYIEVSVLDVFRCVTMFFPAGRVRFSFPSSIRFYNVNTIPLRMRMILLRLFVGRQDRRC